MREKILLYIIFSRLHFKTPQRDFEGLGKGERLYCRKRQFYQ